MLLRNDIHVSIYRNIIIVTSCIDAVVGVFIPIAPSKLAPCVDPTLPSALDPVPP